MARNLRSSPAEVWTERCWCDDLGFCGCGNPSGAAGDLFAVLTALGQEYLIDETISAPEYKKTAADFLGRLRRGDGGAQFLVAVLEAKGLLILGEGGPTDLDGMEAGGVYAKLLMSLNGFLHSFNDEDPRSAEWKAKGIGLWQVGLWLLDGEQGDPATYGLEPMLPRNPHSDRASLGGSTNPLRRAWFGTLRFGRFPGEVEVLRYLRSVLRLVADKTMAPGEDENTARVRAARDAFAEWFGDGTGGNMGYLVLYALTAAGILEHVYSIYSGWLSPAGEEMLHFLETTPEEQWAAGLATA